MLDRNTLYQRATDLGELLATSDEIIRYRDAEAALFAHPRAAALLQDLRATPQAQGLEGALIDPDHLSPELTALLEEIESIPEASDFMEAQMIVQALMQTISQIIGQSIMRNAQLRRDPTQP